MCYNLISKEYSKYIKVKIIEIDDKPVCIVEVSRSHETFFIKRKNEEVFYLRGTAGSQSLK